MLQKNRKRLIIISIVLSFVVLCIWIVYGNTALELNEYQISSSDIPSSFNGYRIAHVSDLHNTELGTDNERLLDVLREANPDIIAITGDIIDSRSTDIEIALEFVEKAMQIAPCYYVTGNHEARVSEYAQLKYGMEKLGVIILDNEQVKLELNGESITLLGIEDPSFQVDYLLGDSTTLSESRMDEISTDEDGFRVLLSHRPELFDSYVKYDMNLVLSVHAHGGQFRLPFVGGIIAPNQGFFPKYDAGLYQEDDTNMIVSRGIGNSLFPFRVNNPPEVILIKLETRE